MVTPEIGSHTGGQKQGQQLDSTGKLYERMSLNRVQRECDDPENKGISEVQYGFRAGRSTFYAVQEVQKRVDKPKPGGS